MRCFDELRSDFALDARQSDHEIGSDAETAFRSRADAHVRGHCGFARYSHLQLLPGDFQRAKKAGRITGGEKLFGIRAFPASPAQLPGYGELHLEVAVFGAGFAVSTAGGGGAFSIFYFD